MKLHIVLTVTIVLITSKASCGVIGNVYDKVSNTTHDMKEDVYSWWTYGVETVMGGDIDKNAVNHQAEEGENHSGLIGKFYSKVKGGVSSGYMTIHDFVLGQDSDPNKGIIKTLYERAMQRLSNIKSYIFGDHHTDEKPASRTNEEDVKQDVLKLLFSNRTDIFNTESEKSALNSLRNKLTRSGDDVLHLADNEKDLLRRAYESVRQKSDDLLKNAGESADKIKNTFSESFQKTHEPADSMKNTLNESFQKTHESADRMRNTFDENIQKTQESADKVKNSFNESIKKTQEFIEDESKKVNDAAKSIGEEVKKSASDIETVRSE